jgi:hypothetical protein
MCLQILPDRVPPPHVTTARVPGAA